MHASQLCALSTFTVLHNDHRSSREIIAFGRGPVHDDLKQVQRQGKKKSQLLKRNRAKTESFGACCRGLNQVLVYHLGFPGDLDSKESACNVRDPGLIPGSEDPLEKGMVTHSSILAWRIPWTEETGGLQSMGSQESDTTE